MKEFGFKLSEVVFAFLVGAICMALLTWLLPVYLAGIITPGCFVIGYFFRDAIKPQIDKLRDIIFKEK